MGRHSLIRDKCHVIEDISSRSGSKRKPILGEFDVASPEFYPPKFATNASFRFLCCNKQVVEVIELGERQSANAEADRLKDEFVAVDREGSGNPDDLFNLTLRYLTLRPIALDTVARADVLDEDGVLTAVERAPDACEKVFWGKRLAAVGVALQRADRDLLSNLLTDAWENKAPTRLLTR